MKTDSEWRTDFLALIILCLIALIIIANAAFIAGYLKGIDRALESQVSQQPPRELAIRERLEQIPSEFNGPMYNKPHLESSGRVGW